MSKKHSFDGLFGKPDTAQWSDLRNHIDERGFAVAPEVLSANTCHEIRAFFEQGDLFRKHIVMQQHGYGQGEYRYFTYPLPQVIEELRESFYRQLAPLANQWSSNLNTGQTFPAELDEFTAHCRAQGQCRPTPLLLRYKTGDYNRLHQDLYGDICFPMQVAILLDRPGTDFEGGEFVLTEQKPRMQSRPQVVNLSQGDAVIFAVNERPVSGPRGFHRVKMRHGVSELRGGLRHTLGLIFHDAS